FRIGTLWPAEVRQQDDLAALVGDFLDGRRDPLNPSRVCDFAVVHRHVEVDAQQHAFALNVSLIERKKSGHVRSGESDQISLPIATAVSAMRLEKPHSLSYQDITRTSVPSMTLVWSMWKIELCGSWLKSSETLGSLV